MCVAFFLGIMYVRENTRAIVSTLCVVYIYSQV